MLDLLNEANIFEGGRIFFCKNWVIIQKIHIFWILFLIDHN